MSESLEQLQTDNLDLAREYASKMQTALISVGFWKTCLNCQHGKHFETTAEVIPRYPFKCGFFDAVPPLDVIVIGCSNWLRLAPF